MNNQFKRLISQIIFLVSSNLGALGLKTGFCYPFFYCQACPSATSACPIRVIEQGVYKHSVSLKLLLYPLTIIGFVATVTGRAVCGWACPIGLLQRATGRYARRVKISKHIGRMKDYLKRIDSYMRYIKYVLLLVLVLLTSYLIGFIFTDICPVGFLVGTIPTLLLYPGLFIPAFYFWVALIIFGLFVILIFIVERGWCRYFCPVGAILSPFNKISMLHVVVDKKEECIHCNACVNICPMGIDVYNMYRDPECILCGKCIDVCPKHIIKYERGIDKKSHGGEQRYGW
ncbi:MAG: 4Fe-4S binding protein [Candidatus Thermoplasmatota archaeon]